MFKRYRKCKYIGPTAEYLKFFSLLFDSKASRSGIIASEKKLPMTYFATLVCLDPDLHEWMELRNHFNHERVLYIIGVLFEQGCFCKDVDIDRLAEYFLSRWKFAWENNFSCVTFNMRLSSYYHHFPEVDDLVTFYWKKACLINLYDPNPKKE